MLKKIIKDKLTVKIFENRALAGQDAARDGANAIRELLAKQEWVNIIFAAAPSQNDTLAALFQEPDIDWTRCRAFHMDEYVGFPKEKKESYDDFIRPVFILEALEDSLRSGKTEPVRILPV